MNKKFFQKHYIEAMKILDEMNTLISDISWSQSEDEVDNDEYSLLDNLYNDLCDVEAELSDKLYDENVYSKEETESEEE